MKKLLRSILILAVVAATLLGVSIMADAATVNVSTAAQFKSIGSKSGGTYKLMKDIKLTSTSQYLKITKNANYVLDLNGHKLSATFYASGIMRDYVPIIVSKGTLSIKNSATKAGTILSSEGATIQVSGGTLYTYSGVNIICNNVGFYKKNGSTIANQAPAIYLASGTYHAKGGTISGICNGILMGGGKLVTYGAGTKTYPTIKGTYCNGLYIIGTSCQVLLKGGKFVSCTSNLSGYYPMMDYNGKSLNATTGYYFYDTYAKTRRSIQSFYYAKYLSASYSSSTKCKTILIRK